MEYASPAAAFSNSLEQFMLQREQAAFRAQQEARIVKHEDEQTQIARERLADERQRTMLDMKEQKRDRFIKHVHDDYGPGDIPSPEDIAMDKELGTNFFKDAPVPATAAAQAPAPPSSLTAPGPQPAPQRAPGAGVLKIPLQVYPGSYKQREEQDKQKKVEQLQQTISTTSPGSPEWQQAVMQYEMTTGKSIPAGLQKTPGTETEMVLRQNPRTSQIDRYVNGTWVPLQGEPPKGAHWMTEQPPKDTSAANDRKAAHVDAVRKDAYTEMDKWMAPIDEQITSSEKALDVLNQNTAQADALMAPMLLKSSIVAGSRSSGVRMTKAEIDNAMAGGTKWEILNQKINQWSTDPQHVIFDKPQRDSMRNLIKAMTKKSYEAREKYFKRRRAITEADDIRTVNRLRDSLDEDIHGAPSETSDYDIEYDPATKTFKKRGGD